MSQLIMPRDVDSKFAFITVAAQRAKQIQNGAKPRVDVRSR
jgi:DNA-directed RNA polymerase omega subunit